MSSPASPPPRILCVDDCVSSLEVRRALLRQAGYDALIASDPPSALAIVNQVDVDLVVLDYSFPGFISGEELARELRAGKPDMPLIMLSGYPDLPDNVRESVDVLLVKGAGGPADLLDAIARLIPNGEPRCVTSPVKDQSQEPLEKSQEPVRQLRDSKAAREKGP